MSILRAIGNPKKIIELPKSKTLEKEEVIERKNRKKRPTLYKRIDELSSKKNIAIITIIGGFILACFGIYSGYNQNGFFTLNLEFILGLIFFIIGIINKNKYEDKISELKFNNKII